MEYSEVIWKAVVLICLSDSESFQKNEKAHKRISFPLPQTVSVFILRINEHQLA